MKIKTLHDTQTFVTWLVRLVEQGDRYGRDDCAVRQEAEPLVEFYDARFPVTDLGHFVSRYHVSTILEGTKGLLLDTGSSEWHISDRGMNEVRSWLRRVVPAEALTE